MYFYEYFLLKKIYFAAFFLLMVKIGVFIYIIFYPFWFFHFIQIIFYCFPINYLPLYTSIIVLILYLISYPPQLLFSSYILYLIHLNYCSHLICYILSTSIIVLILYLIYYPPQSLFSSYILYLIHLNYCSHLIRLTSTKIQKVIKTFSPNSYFIIFI